MIISDGLSWKNLALLTLLSVLVIINSFKILTKVVVRSSPDIEALFYVWPQSVHQTAIPGGTIDISDLPNQQLTTLILHKTHLPNLETTEI